jgi:hypothetical protein
MDQAAPRAASMVWVPEVLCCDECGSGKRFQVTILSVPTYYATTYEFRPIRRCRWVWEASRDFGGSTCRGHRPGLRIALEHFPSH